MSEKILEKYYIDYNYPSVEKLYTILKKDGINILKDKIKIFIDKQTEQQLTKQTKINKKSYGSIVAFHPNKNFQIDLFDLNKYSTYNKNYKFIFAMIDIFSRKAYVIPLKNKSMVETSKALDKIIKDNNLTPSSIVSDNDASFEGIDFQNIINKYDIHHEENILDDHRALGIIDRFARTLKTIITRLFLRNKTKNWIDNIDKIINAYNKSPHSSLNDIAPNDADKQENQDIIYNINVKKNLKNDPKSDLNSGDKVRIKIKGIFKKGTEPTYSDEVYKVLSTRGKTILLDDDNRYKREDLLLVPKEAETELKNVIKEVNKKQKIKNKLNREGMDTTLLK
jgi:hypothetical protein